MLLPRFRSPISARDQQYSKYVNPQWVRLLNILGMNRSFVSSEGSKLVTDKGETYVDFLSGYGVYAIGHHHPHVTESLIDELNSKRPTMLQSYIPELAAALSERLCHLAGGRMERVFFTSTGSEGVESAIKFARNFTKRDGIAYGRGGFHGLTYGALSLMSNPWWRKGFGSLLPNTLDVPFGDIEALELALSTEKYAAFIVEPVQAEAGIILPQDDYLKKAQAICEKTGTLFVLDEVQTGLGRCGAFLAAHRYNVEPDMVILAKALSGGQVPVGALLMRADICDALYSSVDRAFLHASTFGENSLAMRAALATLEVLEAEKLFERSEQMGDYLRSELKRVCVASSSVREVRGIGLMNAIEFKAPESMIAKSIYGAVSKVHEGVFGQMVVKHLFEKGHVLCQMCGNNFKVIKFIPPLTVKKEEIDQMINALESLLQLVEHSPLRFWRGTLKLAHKAFRA